MKKLILIILAISFYPFRCEGQEYNIRRVQNSSIIEADTIVSNHSSDIEAIQQLINLEIQGRSVKMIGSIYEVDIEEAPIEEPIWMEVQVYDTIQITAFRYGNTESPTRAVFNYYHDLMIIKKDSNQVIPKYVFTARLEQARYWPEAKTTYKLVDFPFFFHEADSVYQGIDSTDIRIRTFANRTHCVNHYINGIKKEGSADHGTIACNPGSSEYAGGSFRHSNSFPNLDRSIDNVIRIEAIDPESGRVIGSQQKIISKMN